MSRFTNWLKSPVTLRNQAEKAYGLWLISARNINVATFVSQATGIPREQVWGVLLGKKEI